MDIFRRRADPPGLALRNQHAAPAQQRILETLGRKYRAVGDALGEILPHYASQRCAYGHSREMGGTMGREQTAEGGTRGYNSSTGGSIDILAVFVNIF